MLALPHTNSWGFLYTNQDNGSTTPGTSVVPGASNAEGSWTEIAPDASITTEIQYCVLRVTDGASFAASKPHLLDFAWDAAGGTTYAEVLFQNLACGGSQLFSVGAGGHEFHFPCKIPAGSAIAVRIQGANASAGTVRGQGYFYGKPSRPELWRPAAYAETIGTITNSNGVSFTPGTTAWGTWVSLGTTTKKHFWAQLGVQLDNATYTLRGTHLQLAVGDASNKHIIVDTWALQEGNERFRSFLQTPCQWEIPAGSELWVRGNGSNTADSGWNATAVLFGG